MKEQLPPGANCANKALKEVLIFSSQGVSVTHAWLLVVMDRQAQLG